MISGENIPTSTMILDQRVSFARGASAILVWVTDHGPKEHLKPSEAQVEENIYFGGKAYQKTKEKIEPREEF